MITRVYIVTFDRSPWFDGYVNLPILKFALGDFAIYILQSKGVKKFDWLLVKCLKRTLIVTYLKHDSLF